MNMLFRPDNQVAGFVLKGQLAEVALDRLLQGGKRSNELSFESVVRMISLKDLDPDLVEESTKMSAVYIAIASFENTVRDLISHRLLEEKGANWWLTSVSGEVRRRAEQKMEDEERIRWHGTRGVSPIYFTELKDLISIIQKNWNSFEDLLPDLEWARHIIRNIERSRNVIMHSGQLSIDDIERVGMSIRDWIRQIGA
jgi:hypothetical protein